MRAGALFLTLLFPLAAAFAQPEETLVVLSPHWEGVRYEIESAFREEIARESGRQVAISWRDVGGTSEIIRYVASEFTGSPDSIGIDVLFGGGTDPFQRFKKQGLLQDFGLDARTLGTFPGQIGGMPTVDTDRMWVAPMLAAFGILCNLRALERLGLPQPAGWEELADPRYASWIGFSDPRRSGSLHMAFEVILQAHGWEGGWRILQGMTANLRAMSSDSHRLAQDVADGEIACAPAIDSHAGAQIREVGADNLTFVVPRGKSVVSGDAVGIFKGAPHPELSRRFIRFLVGEHAQRILMCEPGAAVGPERYRIARLPVLPAMYTELPHGCPAPRYDPYTAGPSFHFDSNLSAARWETINELTGAFLLEPMERLKTLRETGSRIPVVPVTESEASERSERWSDPLTRARDASDWRARARNAYGGTETHTPSTFPAAAFLLFLVAFVVTRAAGRVRRRHGPEKRRE